MASSNANSRSWPWLGATLLFALILFAVLRSTSGTRLDDFTVDEPWHVVAGASYWRTADFRLNPEHPPLVKLAAGAGLPRGFRLPATMAPTEKAQERELVQRIMFEDNDNLRAQQRTRIALWTFNGLLLLALGLLAWRAFGLPWALGTLAFLALEPTVGAHLPVAMTDLPLALTLAMSMLAAGLLASSWRWHWVAATGVAMGLALGAKHSALPGLAGLATVLLIAAMSAKRGGWRERLRRLGQAACAGLLALLVLWAQYGFQFHAGRDGSDAFNRPLVDKIDDLHSPAWRGLLHGVDRLHLLPRAYLWGLADTVRAGVEGRGQVEHLVWGTEHKGRPPWFTWPSFLAAKVPLALLALAGLGAALLTRTSLDERARWSLWTAFGVATAHLAALMSSQGTYGGIRHALPLVIVLALLAGGAVAIAWQRRSRGLLGTTVALYALALVMTAREPRLWEYHNELTGGSRDAWQQFGNEGLALGQRTHELQRYYEDVIAPSGEALYVNTWTLDVQLRAAGMPIGNYVADLHDSNRDAVYRGYFFYDIWYRRPKPEFGWDPAEAFRDLEPVARFGTVEVWHGTQHVPRVRAMSLYNRVQEYIYRDGGEDWALVAARLAEVTPVLPFHVGAAIESGNARLRLDDRAGAAAAYQALLDQRDAPLDPNTRGDLESQVAELRGSTDIDAIKPLRNPWME
jgi:hypothetical protein